MTLSLLLSADNKITSFPIIAKTARIIKQMTKKIILRGELSIFLHIVFALLIYHRMI